MTDVSTSSLAASIRHYFRKPAVVISGEGQPPFNVTIVEMSLSDARIEMPATTSLPEVFDLYIPSDEITYPCCFGWRNSLEAGVRFTGPAKLMKADDTREESATPARRSSTILPVLDENEAAAIIAEIDFGYERHQIQSDRGQILVHVKLSNAGSITAHQPFLCLPRLGLRLEPAPSWSMREVTSVRKMFRFAKLETVDLEPGTSIHCCTIHLPFIATEGGRLEFEAGSFHALNALPDLRLSCISGAGNYPSQRKPLIVAAERLRNHVHHLAETRQIPKLLPPEEQDEHGNAGNEDPFQADAAEANQPRLN